MGDDHTLYRGEDGTAHLIGFRCAHRSTQLSTGWVEGDEIRCLYHGWKYDGSGRCVEQPGEPAPFCDRIRIPHYPTEEYLGLVFAYLGEGTAPPLPRYPAFEREGLLDSYRQFCDWNYFLQLENIADEVHVSFVHRDSVYGERGMHVVPEIRAEENEWGVITYATRPGGRVRTTLHGMPNIASWAASPRTDESGWRHAISWKVPIDDDSHHMFNVFHHQIAGEAAERLRRQLDEWRSAPSQVNAVAKEVLAGRLDIQDVPGDTRLVNRQHIINTQDQIAQEGQGVLDRRAENLGRADAGVVLIRRLWAQELRALHEGRPLQDWHRPADLVPMVGD
jgi:5,5'-dehydrodivanillate O-demethylase